MTDVPATAPSDPPRPSALRVWSQMIKLGHSVFALPFAVFAAFLASGGLPRIDHLLLVVICMVAARSAAMTFNRLVDERFDAANPRTASRPLPAGLITRSSAWRFFTASCLLFGLGTIGFGLLDQNWLPALLALPTLAWLCVYSYTKRFTPYAHLVLGIGIAFSPVAVFIALAPAALGPAAWLLMLAVTCWIAGFDIIYACQDMQFDRERGLKSIPAALGVAGALWVTRLLHFLTIIALVAVGQFASLGLVYTIAVALVAVLLIVENALVSPNDLSKANLAFFTLNGVVSLVFGLLGSIAVLIASNG